MEFNLEFEIRFKYECWNFVATGNFYTIESVVPAETFGAIRNFAASGTEKRTRVSILRLYLPTYDLPTYLSTHLPSYLPTCLPACVVERLRVTGGRKRAALAFAPLPRAGAVQQEKMARFLALFLTAAIRPAYAAYPGTWERMRGRERERAHAFFAKRSRKPAHQCESRLTSSSFTTQDYIRAAPRQPGRCFNLNFFGRYGKGRVSVVNFFYREKVFFLHYLRTIN